MKIGIVGCGAAGGTAAQFARKTNRDAEIVLYDGEGYGQYAKCALPLVLAGKKWEDIVEFPPAWFEKQRITYRNETVTSIDMERNIIRGKETEHCDALIIATGALPACPFEAEGIFFLRRLDDALALRRAMEDAQHAIIIGAGLVGLEAAEAMMQEGITVTVLEYMPHILPAMLDRDMAEYVMKQIDLNVVLNCRVVGVKNTTVHAEETYRSDMVVVATGNTPHVPGGGVMRVDEHCRAQDNVYAAGDCTKTRDFFGRDITVGLGTIAARQGRVAGINAAGGADALLPPVLAKTTKVWGVEMASVGLLGHEIDGVAAKYVGSDLPDYMNGNDVAVKVVADRSGVVVGGQAVGSGAAKIIDRLALAIYNRMSVGDVARMEHAYAPAVAPTFDAVTIACGMVERKLK